MEKFVCVRLVQANAMDLTLFQFDFDLTFAAFFINADETIYGRFGSRSALKEAERDISIDGLAAALESALQLHAAYPANKESLAGKRGPAGEFKQPLDYPSLKGKFTAKLDFEGNVARSCVHCHQVHEAQRRVYREGGKPFPDPLIRPWPMPEVMGLQFDPRHKAKIAAVEPGSSAESDGFRAGDELVSLQGQPMLSIADVQWVMHMAKAPASLQATVRRNGKDVALALTVAEDWRRGSEISWRPTTWDLRRMATGGLVLEDLPAEARSEAELDTDQMALLVKYVGQYGAHAVGKQAGFKTDDVVVAFDGRTARMSESDLIAYVLRKRLPGSRVPVTVLRNGKRVELRLRMQ